MLATHRRPPAALAALLLAIAPSTASADDPDTEVARRSFAEGQALYAEGRYEDAAARFKVARKARPLPAFDYNIARCYDRLGRWQEALEAYERYAAATPPPPQLPQAKQRIEQLRERLRTEGATPTTAAPTTAAPTTAAPTTAAPTTASPAVVDSPDTSRGGALRPAGIALLAVGAAGLAAGVAMTVLAEGAAGDLNKLTVYDPSLHDAYGGYRTGEIVGFVVGGVAAVAGTVLLVLHHRRPSPRTTALADALRLTLTF